MNRMDPLILKTLAPLNFSGLGLMVDRREMDLRGGRMMSLLSRTAKVDIEFSSLDCSFIFSRIFMRSSISSLFFLALISCTSS